MLAVVAGVVTVTVVVAPVAAAWVLELLEPPQAAKGSNSARKVVIRMVGRRMV